jgi:hypothetical protein
MEFIFITGISDDQDERTASIQENENAQDIVHDKCRWGQNL